MEKKSKKTLAKELTTQLQACEQLEDLEGMLKNNVIEFELEKVLYRVRKPSMAERRETRKFKNKKYQELLNDDNYLFREQLIEKLEKKGKSIPKMMEQIGNLQLQIEKLQLKLAEYGKEKEKDNKFITELKLKIYELMQERNLISLHKMDLLSMSIEDEILDFENTYLCYLLLEKKEKDKWVKVFNTYKEFMDNKDDKLMAQVGHYFGLLLLTPNEGE